MQQLITVTACLCVLACRSDERPPQRPPVFACNLNGLTDPERVESRELLQRLGRAIVHADELADGYTFRIDEARLPLAAISRWVELERRCCPFFHFDIAIVPDGGGTWLRLTGAEGVKDFITSELGTPGPA